MIGLGTDIIEVERIRSNLDEYGDKFLSKILTPLEISASERFKDKAPHIAGRFAAKEAVSKAIGTGFGENLEFHDIEIINEENGKPRVNLSERAMKIFGNPTFLLSISHCKSHAVATAIRLT